ncbi:MAG: periplasmic heavy metal sensor [Candidatus Margulisiibacteriota bacterium]
MKKVLSVLLVVFLVAALASQSLAWGRGPQKGKVDREKIMGRIEKKLGLTKDQQEKFKSRRQKEKKEIEAHRKEMKAISDKLKIELKKDNPNRSVLHDLVKRSSQQRTAMELKRMDSLLELRKTLTPEQRKKFKEMTRKQKKRGSGGSSRPR